MPSRPPSEDQLTTFGRWFYRLCSELGVYGSEVALRAGLSTGVMSLNTRIRSPSGKVNKGPDRETVRRLWQALGEIAREKHLPLDEGHVRQHFYHSAHVATDEEADEAESSYQERKRTFPLPQSRGRRKPPSQGNAPGSRSKDNGSNSPDNAS